MYIKREVKSHDILNSGLYRNLEDEQTFNLFVERTQQLLDEHFTRVIAFEGPNQDHKVDEK